MFQVPAAASPWDYTIGVADTPATVNAAATSAVVDTAAREIRLPNFAPKTVAFWPDGDLSFVVLTPAEVKHFSHTGTQWIENTILRVGPVSNPAAIAAPAPFPDVVVAEGDSLRHYSFTGSAMLNNPALAVAGLAGVAALGARDLDTAGLVGGQVHAYAGQVRNPALEPQVPFTNPIDLALFQDSNNMVVLEPNRARYFLSTGSSMAEAPALAITGLTAPKAVAAGDDLDAAIIDGSQVRHYSFNGATMAYNSFLSITGGLSAPTSVALRPGSQDRLVADGDQVRYYRWNGSSFDAPETISVPGLSSVGAFAPHATAESLGFNPGSPAAKVRVRAAHDLPNGTMVTWSVTADGASWVTRWRVRGTAAGTVLEINSGGTWTSIGTADGAAPGVNNAQLWADVTPGANVRWRAELSRTGPNTPKIRTSPPGGVAVRLDVARPPNPPAVNPGGPGCHPTTTPTLTWNFSDPDPGDHQTAYQVQIARPDLTPVLDTGKVLSGSGSYTVATSTAPDQPGPLWSAGEYQFRVRVKVWDSSDLESAWSSWADFCVTAFERPRIAGIASPPPGQTAPVLADPATHIVILPGMAEASLPKAKAGARVTVIMDSVGPLTAVAPRFPYRTLQASTGDLSTLNPWGSKTNRFTVDFWTSASLADCPTGTVVQMDWSGTASTLNPAFRAPPYAAGVIRTEGTVLDDFFVILKGKDN